MITKITILLALAARNRINDATKKIRGASSNGMLTKTNTASQCHSLSFYKLDYRLRPPTTRLLVSAAETHVLRPIEIASERRGQKCEMGGDGSLQKYTAGNACLLIAK